MWYIVAFILVIALVIYLIDSNYPIKSTCTGKCNQGRNCTCKTEE